MVCARDARRDVRVCPEPCSCCFSPLSMTCVSAVIGCYDTGRRPLLESEGTATLHPAVVRETLVYCHRAFHAIMAESTQLGASQHELPCLLRLEPHGNAHARHRILLHAEFRQEEGMNHILRLEMNPHYASDRQFQAIATREIVRISE